jgi:hypothetical protein
LINVGDLNLENSRRSGKDRVARNLPEIKGGFSWCWVFDKLRELIAHGGGVTIDASKYTVVF